MKIYEKKNDMISVIRDNKGQNILVDKKDKILCNHCLRTASNGIRCLGICVADNDY